MDMWRERSRDTSQHESCSTAKLFFRSVQELVTKWYKRVDHKCWFHMWPIHHESKIPLSQPISLAGDRRISKDIHWVMRGDSNIGQAPIEDDQPEQTPKTQSIFVHMHFHRTGWRRKVTGHLAVLWKFCRPVWFNKSFQQNVHKEDFCNSTGGGWKRLRASAVTFSRPGICEMSA